MPFVQISLLEGKGSVTKTSISDAVHQALVEEFGIPELDKFQTINEVQEGNLLFPPEYLGIPHSSDIVFVYITAKLGRTATMKRALYAKIALLIHQKTAISKDDVAIVLTENSEENWSFGQGEAQLIG